MAGAQEIHKMIQSGRTTGRVVAVGTLQTPNKDRYAIIKLDKDQGLHLAIDYGSDIRIADNLLGKRVHLVQYDDYAYSWEPIQEEG